MAFGSKPLAKTTEQEKKALKDLFKPSVELEVVSGLKIGV